MSYCNTLSKKQDDLVSATAIFLGKSTGRYEHLNWPLLASGICRYLKGACAALSQSGLLDARENVGIL
jgi:hypothetical protein